MAEQGEFQEYTVPLKTEGILTQIRVDPGLDSGVVEIAKIELVQIELNPLKFGVFSISDGKLRFSIRNDGDADVKVRIAASGLDGIAEVPARGSAERVCCVRRRRQGRRAADSYAAFLRVLGRAVRPRERVAADRERGTSGSRFARRGRSARVSRRGFRAPCGDRADCMRGEFGVGRFAS